MPSITDLRLSEREGTFFLRDATSSFANAIRVAMSRDVPTPAVTRVVIRKNTSFFPCEWIAHRIGMIPLSSSKHKNILRLTASGPGRVYSSQIEDQESIVEKDVLIVRLAEGQELDMDLHVSVDTGSVHARHNPAVAARFAWVTPGMRGEEECMCSEGKSGDEGRATGKCERCGYAVVPPRMRGQKKVVRFDFETTGTYTAEQLLSLSISSIHTAISHVNDEVRILSYPS